MNPLPLIPTPPAQRWREFRLRGIPAIVFLAGLAGVGVLWNKNLVPSNIVGEVQGTSAIVASTVAGLLTELRVDQYDHVTAGQPVAKVITTSPENMEAALATIKSDLIVMQARMTQDQQRNNQSYQQLRLDLLSQRVDLAATRARLAFAENEFKRNETLFNEKIVSAFDYEFARDQRDALVAEVEERSKLVTEFEQTLQEMRPAVPSVQEPLVQDTISAAITAQEEQLRRTEGGTTLRAPMNGIVSIVYRRSAENIAAGEPILTISSEKAERIIGFIRLPISYQPKVGDTVEIRTRGSHAQKASATIQKVGSRMELFTQPLRVRGFAAAQERGLPILVNLPENLNVYPGEIVDLFVKQTVE
ncbi:MAG TPA: HlyD family efflux transporter periplasmic adaptor subunit [Verrucomicrobiae bacterium]|nr:HlyD family efflux transporter periplasmic adaptor subunit [Verrucomicrobiae bacterium]